MMAIERPILLPILAENERKLEFMTVMVKLSAVEEICWCLTLDYEVTYYLSQCCVLGFQHLLFESR